MSWASQVSIWIYKFPGKLLIVQDSGGGRKAIRSRRPEILTTRKDRRKAERSEKKAHRGVSNPPAKRQKTEHSTPIQRSIEKYSNQQPLVKPKASKYDNIESLDTISGRDLTSPRPTTDRSSVVPTSSIPKSILKTTRKKDPNRPADHGARSPSPPPKRVPKVIQERLDEDDARIAFLEKKLGIKGKKKQQQSFSEDGLDELLSGLSGLDELDGVEDEGEKAKRDGESWLAEKRRQATTKVQLDDNADVSEESDDDSEDDLDFHSEDDVLEGPEVSSDEFSGFEADEAVLLNVQKTHVKENPYVAPIAAGTGATAKYIPPSLRKTGGSDPELIVRLRRQTQGLVNRLTESNLISILADIEKLYRDNPRQHVTSTLVELLLASVCEPTSLPDTLIILPAGFISAIYKVIGTDFGAQVVQRIVELFSEHYGHATRDGNTGPDAAISAGSKETTNLITILSELYNFQVVGSNLIFDYIRLFLGNLSELNAELLLKIIRSSGSQLRKDDPSSLKDIVSLLRPAVERMGEDNLSVRTKFMIETINDLKNNKMKTGAAASAVVSEHLIRMKKTLGSLNTRSIKGSEPLRIGLKDIQDSDKRGKWWLVGASWAGGSDNIADGDEIRESSSSVPQVTEAIDPSTDLVALARAHRMNTDIRRAIFMTIMSSTDFSECHLRLLKLRLKKVQELEIPKVLIYCAGAEAGYNHYYTLIAKKFCEADRKLKMAFQFGLWDLFKRIGEGDDELDNEEDAGNEEIELRALVNSAKMFGSLLASRALSLHVLKKLTFIHLQDKTKMFLEVMFITIFLQLGAEKEILHEIFDVLKDTGALGQGILRFIRKVVRKTEVAGGKKEKEKVVSACNVAIDHLQSLQ